MRIKFISTIKIICILFAVVIELCNKSNAQISITTTGSYSQNFNSLIASGTSTWTNNSTISNWYHTRTGAGNDIVANDGSVSDGNLYSYGIGTETDRSLGSIGSGNLAVGFMYWGVKLVNNTGSTLNSITVSYTGEQWRNSGASAQTLYFSYLVGSPTVTGSLAEFQSAGVDVISLNFTSPTTGGTATALNGNQAANRIPLTYIITGMNVPNGSEFILRWADPDHTGADHGLSIDDLSISWDVVPAPPTVTINKAAIQTDPTTSTPINFTVVFSEDVTGFEADDISFTGSTVPGTLVATVSGTGKTYNVEVNGITGSGNVVASVLAEAAANSTGHLSLASTSTDNVVQFIGPPTITCPGDITVNSPQGGCSANVSFTGENDIQFNGTGNFTVLFYVSNNGGTIASGIPLPSSYNFPSGVNNVQVTITDNYGNATCNFKVTVIDNQPPVLNCSDITVDAFPGQCYADVPYLISGTENCARVGYPVTVTTSSGYSFNSTRTNFAPNTITEATFGVGTRTVIVTATDAAGNTATCSYTITVVDKQVPVITNCPSAVTVSCASQIPSVNISSVTASDNCGSPTITHVGDVISNQVCSNKYTVTRTYMATDGSGNTATCSQTITVNDITPPTITGLTPSKRILAPPNHRMVDITLAYTINDNCVSTPNVSVSITSNEPVNGTGDGDTDPDWEVIDNTHIRLRAERSAQGTGRIYTITVTVSDGCNAPVSATTEVVVAHNIKKPNTGQSFKAGSTVSFEGEFWDMPGKTHTAKWVIDGSILVNGVVTEPNANQNGKITGSYKFNSPGVYKLQMNTTDQSGVTNYANTNGDIDAIVVIYDPNGGYAYGGGWYPSPAGALVSDPNTTGKASYGFAVNYRNAAKPKGETQFEFKVGSFEFNALNFEYLSVAGAKAQFRGTGKVIGGQSGVSFIMTVMDGALDGTGIDKIRLKLFKNGQVYYDNQFGAGDADNPTTAVGTNSIIFIQNNQQQLLTQSKVVSETGTVSENFELIAWPNPTADKFSVQVKSDDVKTRILLQVFDQNGRIIKRQENIPAGSIVQLGELYRPGVYYVRIIQGKEHRELKLVKLSD